MRKTTKIAMAMGSITLCAVAAITYHLRASFNHTRAIELSQIEQLLALPSDPDASFKLLETRGEQAMIMDQTGIWVVEQGSLLPDGSQVEHIWVRSIRTSQGNTISVK